MDLQPRLLFLDAETTGHEPLRLIDGALMPWHEIIDIGAVLWDGETILSELSLKVRPEHPERCITPIINNYPARAARGEWDDALPLKTALGKLLQWCELWRGTKPLTPIGQNFSFDWLFLSVAFAVSGIREATLAQLFHYARLDTRSMAVQALWRPGTPYEPADYSIRTDGLSRTLGVSPEPIPHVGLNGARQSLAVYHELRARAGGGV